MDRKLGTRHSALGASFLIRRASLDDAAQIAAVHIASIKGICAPSGFYTPEQIEAWLVGKAAPLYADPITKYEFFVAVTDGAIVGFGDVEPCTRDSPEGERLAEIRGLYFHPDAVGRGWGMAMVRHLELLARAYDPTGFFVMATLVAEPFYARAGFTTVERCWHTFRTGVRIPCLRMTKPARP